MNDSDVIDLKRLYLIIRRQLVFMTTITLLFAGLAVAYVTTTTPKFTAKSLILLDKSFSGAVSDISVMKKMAFEPAAIQSEVEVVRSRRVTDLVINKLLAKGYLKELKEDPSLHEQIVAQFLENLKVMRNGETYVLSISYTDSAPQVAADISNAYAEAYITDQLNASSETSTRTFSWLEQKTNDLKDQLTAAQQKVNTYRYAYNQQREAERLGKTAPGSSNTYSLNELLNLEKDVESLGALLNSYIERREEMSAQTSFPITETRIISAATTPKEPSHPKKTLLVGAAVIIGLGLSFLLALMRDYFDRALRRAGQVKKEIGVPFLGFFPKSSKRANKLIAFKAPMGEDCGVPMYSQSLENEFSLFAETVRAVKNAIDEKCGHNKTKVIGVVSTFPYEGVSEVSTNLALYAGKTGNTTLYINGNFRRFTKIATQKKTARKFEGLAGVFLRGKPLKDVALENDMLNLSYLPSLASEAEEVLQSFDAQRVKGVLTRCQNNFQYVIIDLPPLMATADLYYYSQAVDGFVIVSEWGRTLSNNVNFYLQQANISKDKIIGVVLNKTNMKQMRKFYGHLAYSR